jgi:hypothetical protein
LVLKLLAFVLPLDLDFFAIVAVIVGETDVDEKHTQIIASRGLALIASGLSIRLESWLSDLPLAWLTCP